MAITRIVYFCKHGKNKPGTITVTLELGESTDFIRHIPAIICSNCSEEYLDEQISDEILALVLIQDKLGEKNEVCYPKVGRNQTRANLSSINQG